MMHKLKKSDLIGNGEATSKLAQFMLDFLKYKGEQCCRREEIDMNKFNPEQILKTLKLTDVNSNKLYSILAKIANSKLGNNSKANSCITLSLLSQSNTFNNFINLKYLNG